MHEKDLQVAAEVARMEQQSSPRPSQLSACTGPAEPLLAEKEHLQVAAEVPHVEAQDGQPTTVACLGFRLGYLVHV